MILHAIIGCYIVTKSTYSLKCYYMGTHLHLLLGELQMLNRITNGSIIKQRRKELGKTQRQLADESYINRAVISQIENGKFTGSLKSYEKCINGLGLELVVAPIKSKIPDFDDLQDMFEDED